MGGIYAIPAPAKLRVGRHDPDTARIAIARKTALRAFRCMWRLQLAAHGPAGSGGGEAAHPRGQSRSHRENSSPDHALSHPWSGLAISRAGATVGPLCRKKIQTIARLSRAPQ